MHDDSCERPIIPAAVARIVDANENRASEGLRTVEDYFRFACNEAKLAARCKHLRHELASILAQLPLPDRLLARDATSDVGRHISTPQEQVRESVEAVLRASFKRITQALRSLEEWTKTQHVTAAGALEQLRYQVYELESQWAAQCTGPRMRLQHARLYVLVDGADSESEFIDRITQLVEAEVEAIQLRDKRLSDRVLHARATKLRQVTVNSSTLFLVNDRVDIAVATGADGVHLGQDDLPPETVRRLLPSGMLLGISTHSIEQARRAVEARADYLGAGPTFPSRTKSFERFPGPAFLRQIAAEIKVPTFAIGGISLDNLSTVQQAGISRVAVSSSIWQAASVREAVIAFRRALFRSTDVPGSSPSPPDHLTPEAF